VLMLPSPEGERDHFLVSLDDTLRSLDDATEMAGIVVRALSEHLQADRVVYVEFRDRPDESHFLAEHGCVPPVGTKIPPGRPLSELLRGPEPWVVSELRGEESPMYAAGLQAMVAVPLHDERGLRAALLVGTRGPRRWAEGEVELAAQVARRCRDWLQLARAIRGARESEERLRLIMSNVRDHAIFTLDPLGRVTAWNSGAEQVFGWTAEEMLGNDTHRIFTPEDQANQRPLVELELAIEGRIAENERYHMRKDGSRFFSTGSLETLRDEGGELRGFVKVVRDISDKKRIEEERERLLMAEKAARTEAERVGRMKDEFLATLSHELRTPLTSIIGWAQLLGRKSAGMPEEMRQGIEIIHRNAKTQAQLIDDLLDMNRIVSGNVRLELEEVDPVVVLRTTLDIVGPIALARGVHLGVELSPGTGRVQADGSRLQQVLWNLLHNAIKFTPTGGRVQVTLHREGSEVLFQVSDTGLGLAPDFLPHVFERFRQADASTTRRHGGLGLGLSIVKHLVELHQGRVWVESEGEGRGSRFFVALPALQEEVSHLLPGPEPDWPAAAQALRGVRALVVEDEPDTLALLQELLTAEGAQVVTADSAEQAMVCLGQDIPDVLVSDIGMPQMDGYELIRRVRELPAERGGGLPAVALTAFARDEDRVRALDAGYHLHLAKPIEPEELVSGIQRLVAR
jgi:PAS domain S-box-containing protein